VKVPNITGGPAARRPPRMVGFDRAEMAANPACRCGPPFARCQAANSTGVNTVPCGGGGRWTVPVADQHTPVDLKRFPISLALGRPTPPRYDGPAVE